MGYVIIGAIIAFLIMWGISVWHRLVAMNENIDNAMSQIGVQLSARFDALIALLDVTKEYALHETQMLKDILKSHRYVITATSTPEDVGKMEGVMTEVLGDILAMAEQFPELKTTDDYAKYISAVDCYKKMVCTSSLIYNDSVTKLNRELRLFPTFLLAAVFGFRQREYLETVEEKTVSILS